jgi:hypothetical protein
MRFNPSVCALLAALVCVAPAHAGEAEDAAAKLIASFKSSFDERFAGTSHLGIYMGKKRLGAAKIVVSQAPSGSGAVYQETVETSLAFGPNTQKMTLTSLFNAKLALVSQKKVETESKGDKQKITTTVRKRDGEAWVQEETVAGGETTTIRAKGGDNYDESLTLMAVAIAAQPGNYAFQGIKWTTEGKWQRLTLGCGAPADFDHRGKKVKAVTLTGHKGEDEAITLVVKGSSLLLMAPGGAPIKMIGGTAEECSKDLPGAGAPATAPTGSGSKTPMGCVELYLRTMAGSKGIETLDLVFDWKAVHAQTLKEDPELAVDVDTLATLLKAELKKVVPIFGPELVDPVLGMLKASEAGDTAFVTKMTGMKNDFKLRKLSDGTWRLLAIPQ